MSAGGGFGGGRSQYHLRQIGVFLDLHFINKPEFFINAFQPPAKFNSDGDLIDEDAKNRLKEILLSLKAFTLRLQGQNWNNHDSQKVLKNKLWILAHSFYGCMTTVFCRDSTTHMFLHFVTFVFIGVSWFDLLPFMSKIHMP